MFICEAYFYDWPVRFHLDYMTLMAQRSRLTCKRLILIHLAPDMLAHFAELPVEAAYDGLEILL